MILRMRVIALFICFASGEAFAKTLLVSDIDDTLKVSHIKSFTDSLASAFKTGPAFRGMADLYNLLATNSEISIVYVTNAPKSVMEKSHTQFIAVNAFPKKEIYFFTGGDKENHKFNTISGLLKDNVYDSVILIGDNGEKDPISYHKIKEAFPLIHFQTFIHAVYDEGTALGDDDVGFMNPGAISLLLCRAGFLDPLQELQFRQQMNNEILQNVVTENQVFTTDWSTTVSVVDNNLCL